MFRRTLIPVWISIILLSGMFLMGQDTWPPQPTSKTVFVTDGMYDGNLGGLGGADAICQTEADSAGLTGVFKAWLSDSSLGPDGRFVRSNANYVLMNDEVIALGWEDLTDSVLDHEINVSASGYMVRAEVWTNTSPNGAPWNRSGYPSLDSCNDWTSSSAAPVGGGVGGSWYTDENWTEDTSQFCDHGLRLYCFQQ